MFQRVTQSSYLQINKLPRDQVESDLQFVGFLIFHCPLKPDAVETPKELGDASHRVNHATLVSYARS